MARAPEQLGLFTGPPVPPRPPANFTPTSREAARSVRAKAADQEAKVLAYIEACGPRGATNEEIAAGLGLLIQSVCGRTNGLWAKHAIRDSGDRRPGLSGRSAKVWVRAGQ